ncbi:MAG: histidine phosphatase family protein [bacterium]
MKTIYLVRHGQTDANKEKLWIGARSLYKLNRDGRLEAMEAGSLLRDMDLDARCIYTSPVQRAFQSAGLISTKLELPLIPIPNLSEMFFGDVDGMSEEQFKSNFPVDYQEWVKSSLMFSPPNGESGQRFLDRSIEAIKKLAFESDTKDIIVVTHSGVIKMFLANIMGVDLNIGWRKLQTPETPTGSITKISMKDGKFFFLEVITSEGQIDG